MTQSITGRPATFNNGLGTRWVWGRSRVPFPASGMITCISPSSVSVLETHQIVQLRGTGLEHVTIHHRLDLMDHLGRDVDRLTGLKCPGLQALAVAGSKGDLPREYVHRLVLHIVILQTEHVTSFHVENFSDIAISPGPDQLVAPRLLDSVWHVGHGISVSMGSAWAGIWRGGGEAGKRGSKLWLEAEDPAELEFSIAGGLVLGHFGPADIKRKIESGYEVRIPDPVRSAQPDTGIAEESDIPAGRGLAHAPDPLR